MTTEAARSAKQMYRTANPFEEKFGYCRGVRKGPFIFVSGTTALKVEGERRDDAMQADRSEGQVWFARDAEKQAKLAMNRCLDAVEKLGGMRKDVVRVKMFVARHQDCSHVGEAFRICFGVHDVDESGEVGAAATMIVVQNGFVDPDILVEVEVDAVVL